MNSNAVRKVLVVHLICSIVLMNSNYLNASVLRRSCGAELSKRIGRICESYGGYNSPRGPHHRVRGRVADECCKRICSDSVISQYCYSSSEMIPRQTAEEEVTLDQRKHVMQDSSAQYHNGPGQVSVKPSEINSHPIRIGTVAPEYNKIAMTPPLYRSSYYTVEN